VDFERLGLEFELTGGQIQNAVRAAVGAAAARIRSEDDGTAITMADFQAAARAELRGFRPAKDGTRVMGFR
jgi:hypothetical protein